MKKINLSFCLILAAAVAFTACQKKSAPSYEYTSVTRGQVQNIVSAVGTLEPESSVVIQGPASGIIDALYVQAGDSVSVGQKIADINTTGNPRSKSLAAVYSPIDGVVADCSISVGGTVLGRGSPAATTLFTLFSSSNRLLISASIGELDIGSVKIGQDVKITLQAVPGKTFESTVSVIKPLAATTDNVVTYTVQCEIENDGTLRPGMTAALQFVLQKETGVLTVPNAALRFTPETSDEKSDTKKSSANAVTNALTGGKAGSTGGNPFGHPTGSQSFYSGENDDKSADNDAAGKSAKAEKTLWYEDENGKLGSVKVLAGISDGLKTVVESTDGTNLEGLKVILRVAE